MLPHENCFFFAHCIKILKKVKHSHYEISLLLLLRTKDFQLKNGEQSIKTISTIWNQLLLRILFSQNMHDMPKYISKILKSMQSNNQHLIAFKLCRCVNRPVLLYKKMKWDSLQNSRKYYLLIWNPHIFITNYSNYIIKCKKVFCCILNFLQVSIALSSCCIVLSLKLT